MALVRVRWVRLVMQAVLFLLKGYVGLVTLLAAAMVSAALAVNLAPARLLAAVGGGAWSARDLLRLRLEQRLVLLAFGLALLLASWVAAMRAGGWSLGTTVGLAAVTVLLAAWRGVVVRRAASCLADEATAQLALRDYGDGLTVTVFLGTLLAVATFGGGDLLQGVLLLAATGIAAMVTFGAMLTYYDVVDPVQVHGG